jgi:hypothetical protein
VKKCICTYIHEGGWPIGKLPYSEETLESDENQRVEKFTKIADRWNHYPERKGNARVGISTGRGLSSPPTHAQVTIYNRKEIWPIVMPVM